MRHCHGSQTSGFFVNVDNQLQQMVEDFYNRDFNESINDEKTEISQDERHFMQNAQETAELKDGHYQPSLPFKNPEALVPNNKSQPLQLTNWLKKKLERDPKLYEGYKAFMEDIVAKGYARKVPPDQGSLEEGKSAMFMGKSLNGMLYKGPDLTNSLVGVITRFREDRVAVMADIESMFYQVRVPDRDSSFL